MSDNTPPVAHTPLPYLREGALIYALDESGSVNRISMRLEGGYTGRNRERTTDEEFEATAAFFVHAVNSHSDLVEALRAVEAAMIRGGDGRILDVGWNITKLNEARPMIRAILTKAEAPHG